MKRFIAWMVILCALSCSGKPPGTESAGQPHDLPPVKRVETSRPTESVPREEKPKPPEKPKPKPKSDVMTLEEVQESILKFHPVDLVYPEDELSAELIPVVARLVEAARVMDELFLLQVSPDNPDVLVEITEAVKQDPEKQAIWDYFSIMFGPWNRMEDNKPFWGTAKKPPGAGYYGPGITRATFEAGFTRLENALKTEKNVAQKKKIQEKLDGLRSLYTFIARRDGEFVYTWYHERFREPLARVVRLLEEAAELTNEPSLKRFLILRAKALQNDRYRESDFAWLDLKGDIEFLIGPYDVYEDNLMGYKAAYAAYVNLVDGEYSAKLKEIKSYRKELDRALPYDDKYRKTRNKAMPIVVVNQLYTGGEPKAGLQTMAINLPNDGEVRRKKGFKHVLFRNVSQAKFDAVLKPIARKVLNPAQLEMVTFDAFFTHVLFHEIMHGLGPDLIRVGKKEVEVRMQLMDFHAANEEAKADIGGLMGLEYMVNRKKYPPEALLAGYVTFVASVFRNIRFGTERAHGKASLMALNYLLEQKALVIDRASLTVTVVLERMPDACRSMVSELLKIQTSGDPGEAGIFEKKYAVMTDPIRKIIQKLADVPVDIVPRYTVLKALNQ